MQTPNFHDGYFDGVWIGPDKLVHFFLRTAEHQSFILTLEGVQALTLTGFKQGNIILGLAIRGTDEITDSDIAGVYGVGAETAQSARLLNTAREWRLQILEIDPSYGAEALALFHTASLSQREVHF